MKSKNTMLLRIAGTCGIVAPILAFTFIYLAVKSHPQFSWMDNAISDLGVVPGVTEALLNYGLITSGILFFIFSIGMSLFLGEKFVSRIGAFVLALACSALVAIGVFPENVKPTHYLVSVAFFVLLPISMLIIAEAFWLMRKVHIAVFTLLMAVAAAAPWILHFSVHYVSGVAIPEAVSGLAGAVWTAVLGYKMMRKASRAKVP